MLLIVSASQVLPPLGSQNREIAFSGSNRLKFDITLYGKSLISLRESMPHLLRQNLLINFFH